MYSKRERLANAIWNKMEPLMEAAKSCGQPMSVRFDAKNNISIKGFNEEADEFVAAIEKAEEEYSIRWDIITISFVARKAEKNKDIKVEWKTDPDTGVYIDWSEYFEFSV